MLRGGGGNSSGGSVSVTSASNDVVINPSPGTGTFTVSSTNIINAQAAATSYTILSTDMGKTVTHASSVSVAVTLPQAGTTGFESGKSYTEVNLGTGTVTITPTTSSIFYGGASSATLALGQGQTAFITSNGTNYIASVTSNGTGTVNSGTQYQIANYAATGTAVSGSSSITTNSSGQLNVTNATGNPLTVTTSDTVGGGFRITNNAAGGNAFSFSVDANGGADPGSFSFYDVNADKTCFNISGTRNTIAVLSGGVYAFSTAAQYISNTFDTGISRGAAATINVGNGTAADTTGAVVCSSYNSTAAKTTVSGSTSGNAIFRQPFKGTSYKMVLINCSALLGTASYTFPTAFTSTPQIVTTNGPAAGIVTSLSTTAVTLTGATTSGYIELIGD